ncbi:odorant receptor 85b-like [Osmia bicornis bicornis]|uniref:odorant receptor 85b-like n=1 Tax=Osmia bicornis bicornis TaxID=1437191 RepID=UPI001EAEBFA6|nr:odorant receptor 85b-like [Osmia bicornis bicornis]
MRKLPRNSIDYYLLPNKILCSMIGIWPPDEKRSICSKLFASFLYTLSLIAAFSVFVPGLFLIAVNWGDLKILTGVGCVSTTLAQLLFKKIYLVARREKSCGLYKELRSLWDSTDDPKERQSYEEFAYWARICSIIFYSSGTMTVIIFTISAACDYIRSEHNDNGVNGRHLPFDVWYGTDVTQSPNFEIAFVCQFLAALLGTAGICAIDTTCVTTILHISGQFRLISTWISNIGIEIRCHSTNYISDRSGNLATDLIKCIRHHQRLINVVNDVNDLLTPIIFLQLLTSGIEICLSGFAVMSNGSNADLFKFISYLLSMMIQLLLWCWPGAILVQESQDIGYAVYLHVPWYKLPLIYRRQLLLMILRSQKYCSISALTFQTLSIHTLTSVFNTATSYFALLRQMQEEEVSKS